MDCYKLRIRTSDKKLVKDFLERYTVKYIVGFEKQDETENPHCHAYLETIANGPALRAAIRLKFGAGNGTYSLKTVDHEPLEYLSYLIKDGDYVSKGIDADLLLKAKEYDEKVKDDIKQKKASRKTILQQLDEGYDWTEDPWVPSVTDYVISYYVDKGVLIRQFQVVSLV